MKTILPRAESANTLLHLPVHSIGGVSLSLQMAAERKKLARKKVGGHSKDKGDGCLEFKLAELCVSELWGRQ